MIPEPLSAVAAEMVSTHDGLLRERAEFYTYRALVLRKLRTLKYGWIAATVLSFAAFILNVGQLVT